MKHLTAPYKQANNPKMRTLQAGMGLIEVLVSIILLSSVLLGAVALQFATAKEQRSAQFTNRAALLANEIAERMRANRTAMANTGGVITTKPYVTADTEASVSSAMTAAATTTPSPNCMGANVCDAAQVAAYDLDAWWKNIRTQMPSDSVGVLTVPGAGLNAASRNVVIVWHEPVTDKDQSGNPIAINDTNNRCPASVKASAGMRCYVQYVSL